PVVQTRALFPLVACHPPDWRPTALRQATEEPGQVPCPPPAPPVPELGGFRAALPQPEIALIRYEVPPQRERVLHQRSHVLLAQVAKAKLREPARAVSVLGEDHKECLHCEVADARIVCD